MKKIIISWMAALCLFINITTCTAQEDSVIVTQDRDYTQVFDSIQGNRFINVKPPTGVLYNRVYGWSNLAYAPPIQNVDKPKLKQAWFDLYTATYENAWDNLNLNYTQFTDYLLDFELEHTHPIIAFNYNFNMLDSTAADSINVSVDTLGFLVDTMGHYVNEQGQLVNAGIRANPYITRHANLLGLYHAEFVQNTPTTIVLDPKLLLQNTGNSITKVSIYNDNTLLLTLLPNSRQVFVFNQSGTIKLRLVCELSNGASITSLQTIFVQAYKQIRAGCNNSVHDFIESTIPFKGYDEQVATTTFIEYQVFHKYLNNDPNDCDTKVTKPIFFLDGFDPLNDRKINTIYDDFLKTTTGTDGNVATQLRLLGYDLIIVNFPRLGETINPSLIIPSTVRTDLNTNVVRNGRDGGTDFVERNAMGLVALIQRINTQVANNTIGLKLQQSVIVGPSMGGQISRYALAYMEKRLAANPIDKTWDHKCRLWLSFDSPHEGANILLGVQQALDHYGNFMKQVSARDKFNTQLRSNAARQFLIDQMDGLNGSSLFHTNYYNGTVNNGFDALNTNGVAGSHGYPMQCRKIAIANGSRQGVETGSAGLEVGFIHAVDPTFGSNLLTHSLGLHLRFQASTGGTNKTYEGYNLLQIKKILGWGPVNVPWQVSLKIPTLGMFRERRAKLQCINYFNFANVNTIFGPLPIGIIPYFDAILKFQSTYTTVNLNTHGCLDAAPGGTIPVLWDLMKGLQTTLIDQNQNITSFAHFDNSCFIPIISALGFKNSNFKWNKRIDDRNLVCSNGGEIYFDNYYAPAENQGHVTITDESLAWVLEELAKGHKGPECVPICATEITGPDFPCVGSGSHNIYSVNVDPSLAPNISWYIYGDVTSTQLSATSALVSPLDLAKYTNQNIIMVTITNPCGADVILTKKPVIIPSLDPTRIKVTLVANPLDPCNLYGWVNLFTNASQNNNLPWSSLLPEVITFKYSYDGINYFVNPAGASVNTMNLQCVKSNATMWVKVFGRCGLIGVFKSNKFVPTPAQTNSNCSCKKETILPDEEANYKIEVYPNPTNDKWQVLVNDFSNIKYADFKLYDLNGKQVWSNYVTEFHYSNVTVPAANLPKGIYLLRVVTDRQTNSIKLLKE